MACDQLLAGSKCRPDVTFYILLSMLTCCWYAAPTVSMLILSSEGASSRRADRVPEQHRSCSRRWW
jgi:hypothetical protein